MIVVLKPGADKGSIEKLKKSFEDKGLSVNQNNGVKYTVLALIGDTSVVDESAVETSNIVHKVMRVQEPFKLANRLFNDHDTVIDVGGLKVGGTHFAMMAGPCAVESEEQLETICHVLKKCGVSFLRGGAFKPRTSPYSFQGLGKKGIEMMRAAADEYDLKIVSEIMSMDQVDIFEKDVDIIQVGARNMQNFAMLKELGKLNKPILLKRGLSATIEEWLMSAEYIMSEGNKQVILCERGIRTFEKYTRNTLDLSAVVAVKKLSHLPVVVDPSHAAGVWWMVDPLAKAAVSAGADGVMVEIHPDPTRAMSDGGQSLKLDNFEVMNEKIKLLARMEGKIYN